MVQVKVLGLTFSQVQAGAYALILVEEASNRRIPIIIGTPEAQSIAIYLEGLNPPRPLTHDFFVAFAQAMDVRVKEISINRYVDGIFHSQVIFETSERTFAMESRASDAIALAIRSDAPIFIAKEIIDEIGVVFENDSFWDEPDDLPEKNDSVPLELLQPEDLQKKLNAAIAREDFEKASYLRDLIHKFPGK
jgi:bifunctional DNase/RNase